MNNPVSSKLFGFGVGVGATLLVTSGVVFASNPTLLPILTPSSSSSSISLVSSSVSSESSSIMSEVVIIPVVEEVVIIPVVEEVVTVIVPEPIVEVAPVVETSSQFSYGVNPENGYVNEPGKLDETAKTKDTSGDKANSQWEFWNKITRKYSKFIGNIGLDKPITHVIRSWSDIKVVFGEFENGDFIQCDSQKCIISRKGIAVDGTTDQVWAEIESKANSQ